MSKLSPWAFKQSAGGLTSVPSAHDTGIAATLGAALTWGDA